MWTERPGHSRVASVFAYGLVITVVSSVLAHEGHEPLPTRGAKPDPKTGKITLSKEAREIIDLKTEEARIRPVTAKTLAYASLLAPWTKHALVSSQLGGRIVRMHVEPGQNVSAGELLAEIDSLEIQSLRLELLNAQNELQLTTKLIQETESLSQSGAVAIQRFVELQSKHAQNQSALELARSKWLSLKLPAASLGQVLQGSKDPNLHYLPIVSPIAGTIIHADLSVGKIIDPKEHLFEIVDLAKIWIKIGVLEKDLHRVEVGQPLELSLSAYPGEVFAARVDAFSYYLDPQTHLGTAWGELLNPAGKPARLLPGMSGQARVVLPGSVNRLAVPAAAVIRDGAERYVFVEQEFTAKGSEYQKKSVYLGRQTGAYLEVRGGEVLPGDRVVTQGAHELAYFFYKGILKLSPETRKDIGLRVESAQSQIVEEVLDVDASVEVPMNRRSVSSSQLTGNIRRILVDRGQQVKAGDILAEVASFDLQNAQLELLRAHLDAELFDKSLVSMRAAGDALPKRRLWETEALYQAAVNRRANSQERLATMGLSGKQIQGVLTSRELVEAAPVRALIGGYVVQFDKTLGHVVRAEEPLFEVHDLSGSRIQAYLSERELPVVRIGQSCRVRLISDPGFVAEGTVVRSGQTVGSENRTSSIWIELKTKPDKLLQHNMLARVSVSVSRQSVPLAVSRSAIIRDGTKSFVFVQKTDGSFQRRHVEPGRSDDRFVEIRDGLQAGEQVATQGTGELQTAFAAIR